jgi:hypothetical protein
MTKPYAPINYGATAVLASLGQKPIGADVLAEFADTPAQTAQAKRPSKRIKLHDNTRPQCRNKCGNVTPHFSNTGLCIPCEDRERMGHFAKSETAQNAPVITSRSEIPSQGLQVVVYMGHNYQFRPLARGKNQWRLSNEQGEMLTPGQVGLDHDVAQLITMYINRQFTREEVNNELRELDKVRQSPVAQTNVQRYEGLLTEVYNVMGLDFMLDYINRATAHGKGKTKDAKAQAR